MKLALALVSVAGCGRLGFEGATPGGCARWSDFGAPSLVAELSTPYDDWSISFAENDLMALSSDWTDPVGYSVAQRTRSANGMPWSSPARLDLMGSAYWALYPSAPPDGSSIYFEALETATGSTNLAHASRLDAVTFGPGQLLASLVNASYNHEPHISADELRLYYATNHILATDNGTFELAFTSRPSVDADFAPPAVIAELETLDDEDSPTLSADELEIIFSSDRPGGLGRFDLYRATRPALGQPFTDVVPLTVLNTAGDDTGAELSADGSALYYNRNTDLGGGQNSDVWVARRACLE